MGNAYQTMLLYFFKCIRLFKIGIDSTQCRAATMRHGAKKKKKRKKIKGIQKTCLERTYRLKGACYL